ncbi:MAG: MoaD/ThiS family protein [Acidimicrobiia bacterium]|nr:MoaD/ThiS family protein [Acidimicrobiia bacterium]
MAVSVRIPTVMRPLAGGAAIVDASGDDVDAVLNDLTDRFPGLADRLRDENGGLHRFVNVFVGDEDIRYLEGLHTAVPDGAEVSIIPAVAGG